MRLLGFKELSGLKYHFYTIYQVNISFQHMKFSGGNTALLIRTVTHFTAIEATVDKHSSSMVIKTDIGNIVLNRQ